MNIDEAAKKYCEGYTPCLEVTIRKAFEAGAEFMRDKLEGTKDKSGMKTIIFVRVEEKKFLGLGGELVGDESEANHYTSIQGAESAILIDRERNPERKDKHEILICRRKYEHRSVSCG